MGNKNSGIIDHFMIDHERTREAREKARQEGRSEDIIIKVKPPKSVKMDVDLSEEYLNKYNHKDTTQKIRIQVDLVVRDVSLVMVNLSSRGETVENIKKKTDELMNSSKELFLSTASCYTKIIERLKDGYRYCVSWRLFGQ